MPEPLARDWYQPATAVNSIFNDVTSLRLQGVEPTQDPRLYNVQCSEQESFANEVTSFYHRVSQYGKERRSGLHVAVDQAHEPIISSDYYRTDNLGWAYLACRAINSRGNPVVGEQIRIFGNERQRFVPTMVLTRANFSTPKHPNGWLIPCKINEYSGLGLKKLHDRLRAIR